MYIFANRALASCRRRPLSSNVRLHNMPSGPAYERLVDELLSGLRRGTPLDSFHQGSGAKNRIQGASGYKHQIDISVGNATDLYLFELKCLQKSIGVQEVMVLAARFADISHAMPACRVHASMVSLKRPSRNVPNLAAHFKIKVEVIEDLLSYGVSFSGHHFVGYVERIHATDHMDAEVIRANGA